MEKTNQHVSMQKSIAILSFENVIFYALYDQPLQDYVALEDVKH